MKNKKKYCLNMSSYKYKSGFKHLLPPIIIKESNNLNVNIENIIPIHNKCLCGKSCPNYRIIIELKQEIIRLIDKISQLKKINEYSIPNPIPHPKSNITPERDNEKNNNNIYTQLINSFRNSSKTKLFALKNKSYKNNWLKNSIFNEKIKLRPNSAKNGEVKDSYDKLFKKTQAQAPQVVQDQDKNESNDKIEKENEMNNVIINNRKINLNFFSSSSRKRNENSIKNKKLNNNQRYENDNNNDNNSYSRNLQFFTHESFSSLRKSKINDLSSLNLHLSNSILSPAIKITPKNLFYSLKTCKENKENKENERINEKENNYTQ